MYALIYFSYKSLQLPDNQDSKPDLHISWQTFWNPHMCPWGLCSWRHNHNIRENIKWFTKKLCNFQALGCQVAYNYSWCQNFRHFQGETRDQCQYLCNYTPTPPLTLNFVSWLVGLREEYIGTQLLRYWHWSEICSYMTLHRWLDIFSDD